MICYRGYNAEIDDNLPTDFFFFELMIHDSSHALIKLNTNFVSLKLHVAILIVVKDVVLKATGNALIS